MTREIDQLRADMARRLAKIDEATRLGLSTVERLEAEAAGVALRLVRLENEQRAAFRARAAEVMTA